jgi:prolyl 4-hydroxylase
MHNLLTVAECEEIIALGEAHLTHSQVVGGDGKNVESNARTSHGLFFDEEYMRQSPLLRSVEYRIAKWTQIPKENGESFYLLRYELGMPELQNEESISNSDGSGKFR